MGEKNIPQLGVHALDMPWPSFRPMGRCFHGTMEGWIVHRRWEEGKSPITTTYDRDRTLGGETRELRVVARTSTMN